MGGEVIRLIVFPGSANLTLEVAREKGFFQRHRLAVEVTNTRSSKEQITGILQGKWDMGHTAADNVIAYVENEGADLFIFMGVGGTSLRLFVLPSIRSFEDLRGKKLSVDALTTGFAFVLKKILHENGLTPGEYKLVSVGGTDLRFEAMMKGESAGTLLTPPFIGLARSAGLKDMGEVTRYIPDYVTGVATTTRRWAEGNRDLLVRYIRANREATDWIFDPENRAEAGALLSKGLSVPPAIAAASFDEDLMHPTMGLYKGARLPLSGLKTVISLRAEVGYLKPPLPTPEKYYDESYLLEASG